MVGSDVFPIERLSLFRCDLLVSGGVLVVDRNSFCKIKMLLGDEFLKNRGMI